MYIQVLNEIECVSIKIPYPSGRERKMETLKSIAHCYYFEVKLLMGRLCNSDLPPFCVTFV